MVRPATMRNESENAQDGGSARHVPLLILFIALAPADQIPAPVDVGRRETVGVSLVVSHLDVDVDVVIDRAPRFRGQDLNAVSAGSSNLCVRRNFIRRASHPAHLKVIRLFKIS